MVSSLRALKCLPRIKASDFKLMLLCVHNGSANLSMKMRTKNISQLTFFL